MELILGAYIHHHYPSLARSKSKRGRGPYDDFDSDEEIDYDDPENDASHSDDEDNNSENQWRPEDSRFDPRDYLRKYLMQFVHALEDYLMTSFISNNSSSYCPCNNDNFRGGHNLSWKLTEYFDHPKYHLGKCKSKRMILSTLYQHSVSKGKNKNRDPLHFILLKYLQWKKKPITQQEIIQFKVTDYALSLNPIQDIPTEKETNPPTQPPPADKVTPPVVTQSEKTSSLKKPPPSQDVRPESKKSEIAACATNLEQGFITPPTKKSTPDANYNNSDDDSVESGDPMMSPTTFNPSKNNGTLSAVENMCVEYLKDLNEPYFLIEQELPCFLSDDNGASLWALTGRNEDGQQIGSNTFNVTMCRYSEPTTKLEEMDSHPVYWCHELLKSLFGTHTEDMKCIRQCLKSATTLLVYGLDTSGKQCAVSLVNFTMGEFGVYINWFGTSKGLFNKQRWKYRDSNTLSGRGLGTFCLSLLWNFMDLCKLRGHNTTCNMYLQCNVFESATVEYYKNRGFKKINEETTSSGMKEMPLSFQHMVNYDEIGFFVNFMLPDQRPT